MDDSIVANARLGVGEFLSGFLRRGVFVVVVMKAIMETRKMGFKTTMRD